MMRAVRLALIANHLLAHFKVLLDFLLEQPS